MRTPRPYLSQSQVLLWESSPLRYIEQYFRGKESQSETYRLGKEVDLALEEGKSEDEIISLLISVLPAYPKRQEEMTVKMKVDKEEIVLLAKIDGIDFKAEILGDYKTGKKWTQKQANESRQLRFYHLVYYLKTGKMLKKLFIHWAETSGTLKEETLQVTGKVQSFEVNHTIIDLLKEKIAVKKAYEGICAAYAKELATIN